jgi:formylglycine-generating enzyme required for sulfatase activity
MSAPIRRIFISSTAEDLEPHRDAAAKAIEQLGHKPEYFERAWAAKDRPTLEACRTAAAEADAVLVVVAHRYGWVPTVEEGGDGVKSVTWHEVDAAKAAGRPVFAFLVDEKAQWTEKTEQDRLKDPSEDPLAVATAVRALSQFRALLAKQPVGFFSTPDSLRAEVSAALAGWLMGGAGTATGAIASLASATPEQRQALTDYLRDLRKEWRQLPLAGVDPDQVDSSSRQPELDRIYVGLNVVEPRPEEADSERGDVKDASKSASKPATRGRRPKSPSDDPSGLAERDQSPWPALDACAHHPRAVILGDPGSGKSTFMRMVAIGLASRALGEGEAGATIAPAFDRPLIPVFVTIRDFASDLGTAKAGHRLCDFVERSLKAAGHGKAFDLLHRMLLDGDAILLLDGLDEIAQPDRRAEVIEAIKAFAAKNDRTRVLVTCRVAAYTVHEVAAAKPNTGTHSGAQTTLRAGDAPTTKAADWRLPRETFPVITLSSFSESQQAEFIVGWYRELRAIKRLTRDPVERTESLRRALGRSEDLRRMAGNPLLLTVMAFVHASVGDLPDKRVVLYEHAVDVLLRRWRQGRDLEPAALGAGAGAVAGTPAADPIDRESVQAILEEVKSSLTLLEQQLWGVARQVHAGMASGGGEQVADISNDTLTKAVVALHPDPQSKAAKIWAVRVIDALKHRAGLLVERRFGIFTFPHRTFQEYLAARDLATSEDLVNEVMALRTAPNDLWRVPILMVGGTFAHLAKEAKRGLPVAIELLDRAEAPQPQRRVEDLVLAADFLCELTEAAVRGAEGGKAVADQAATALQRGMVDPAIKVRDRVRLGAALGRLGDPRQGVAEVLESVGGARYPKIEWCPIEPGPFPMGNSGAEAAWPDESPRFIARIREPFAISRYLITVAQYRMFIDAGGYRGGLGDRFWTRAGMEWRRSNGVTGPLIHDEVFQTPNHPQVGVSWYEATAFCRWLAEMTGWPIRLPVEMEWERAARHMDAREYPWGAGGGDGDPARRANIAGVIGHTSAVGVFAGDCAQSGAWDMAGNVREWCQSLWTDNYKGYSTDARLDDDEQAGARVVRGGSWLNHHRGARCANRNRRHPDDRNVNLGFRVCVCPFSHSDL